MGQWQNSEMFRRNKSPESGQKLSSRDSISEMTPERTEGLGE